MKFDIPDSLIDQIAEKVAAIICEQMHNATAPVVTVKEEPSILSDKKTEGIEVIKEKQEDCEDVEDIQERPDFTFDEVKSEFVRLKRINKTKEAKDVLNQFEVDRISALKKEDYPNIMEIVRSIQ